jgi:hypothetical protein
MEQIQFIQNFKMTKEIIVAAYDKPLDWISNINKDVKITIYRKGNILNSSFDEIKIEPNVGRCVHTFFNHIYTNYNSLADYTYFCQDFPFDHWGNIIDIINNDPNFLNKTASLNIGGYYGYHNNFFGSAWNMLNSNQFGTGKVLTCLSNGYPQDTNPQIDVNKYWEILFEGCPPQTYEFIPGGHFCITSEHVKLRPLYFYSKITDLLEKNPIAPWLIERLECYIFNPNFTIK